MSMQVAGERLVELLKGAAGAELQDTVRAVMLNVAEHPGARALLDQLMPAAEQEELLGQLPVLPFDYRHAVNAR